ncbi:MAG: hypothetical protein K6A98_03780 [Prevotella sp.]|nr:hypothetical protein [Prevotella sp.]
MRNEGYDYGYQTGGYDSGFGPMPEKKKHSFSTVLIVMLVALLVCLVCYDNIVKPIIETMEKKEAIIKENEDILDGLLSDDEELSDSDVDTDEEESLSSLTGGLDTWESSASSSSAEKKSRSSAEDYNIDIPSSEALDRMIHDQMVEQAKELGVSTQGSTSDILDRITHAQMVEQAKELGVSTQGSTSDILDRITKKHLEK